jgi:hypothetical protein
MQLINKFTLQNATNAADRSNSGADKWEIVQMVIQAPILG